jgi:type IV pilus assembly protein PilV
MKTLIDSNMSTRVTEMHKQKGFSMIEVMVTILIVSFGLLGIAGIIVNSLKHNQGAYTRTQASILANDIIGRMRANRRIAEGALLPYNIAINAETPDAGGDTVQNDLNQWRTALANSLPDGIGAIGLNPANLNVTVTVQWNNSRVAGGQANESITIQTRL